MEWAGLVFMLGIVVVLTLWLDRGFWPRVQRISMVTFGLAVGALTGRFVHVDTIWLLPMIALVAIPVGLLSNTWLSKRVEAAELLREPVQR
jgi:hypothetical protein